MRSPDTFAESGSPLQSPNGASAASPVPGSSDNGIAGAIRLAVRQYVAQEHDAIQSIRRYSRAARTDGIKPERVVRLIHTAWDECTAQAGTSEDNDVKRLRLTGVALDAYFADD